MVLAVPLATTENGDSWNIRFGGGCRIYYPVLAVSAKTRSLAFEMTGDLTMFFENHEDN